MADAESISLEETNKIRISLGLAPLKPSSAETGDTGPDGDVPADDEKRAFDNLKALREEQAKTAEEAALRRRLQKARDRSVLNEKLSGQTLGEAAQGENEDLKSWIKRTIKRERELAAKRAEELEVQDQQFQAGYTAEHLEGLKVAHDFADIEEGEGLILTIKDRGVLDEDDDGDELISTVLADKERLKENLDNKIKRPKYDPYADEYNPDTGEKTLLAKYDDMEEKRKKGFFIGGDQENKAVVERRNALQGASGLTTITLDYDRPLEIASDYADPSTIKIKKPKKKKDKGSAKVSALLEDEGLLPDDSRDLSIDLGDSLAMSLSSAKRTYNEDSGLGDDEELQGILAQRRRQALKRRKISRPEDIARSVRESANVESFQASEDGGLVIDDTSEFVRGLEMSQVATARQEQTGEQSPDKMEVDEKVADNTDLDMPDEMTTITEAADQDTTKTVALEDEPIVASSLAATLAALRRTGELAESNGPSNFSQDDLQRRQEILARQQLRRAQQEADARRQREQERENERFKRMTQREKEQYREQENKMREHQEAQQRMREFNDFKFNVDLEYKDEFGHEMSKKDAFKRLSHAFHGKASGTMKKGKYLQKVTEQTKSLGGSTIGGDLSKVEHQREQQKKTGSAHTRLQ